MAMDEEQVREWLRGLLGSVLLTTIESNSDNGGRSSGGGHAMSPSPADSANAKAMASNKMTPGTKVVAAIDGLIETWNESAAASTPVASSGGGGGSGGGSSGGGGSALLANFSTLPVHVTSQHSHVLCMGS